MAESKEKIVTVRIGEDVHQTAKVRIAELGTSFQQVLEDLLLEWLGARKIGSKPRRDAPGESLSKNDAALAARFLDFWHNPHDPVDVKLRKLLEEILEVREKHAKERRKSTA